MGLATALTGLAAGAQLLGGLSARQESKRQARVAQIEAEEKARERKRESERLKKRQLVGFLKSGVTLEGTPELLLRETEELGREDVAAIRRTGRAQAQGARAQGRQALISGIGGAAGIASGLF